MSPREAIVNQFSRPRGVLGWLAGCVMATRPSNRRRNLWTVDLLDIQPHHRILELGCGPGLALQACAARAADGFVVGLDHSALMVNRASRLNRQAIARGRMTIHNGGLDALSEIDGHFDRIFSCNLIQFVADRAALLAALSERLAPGGILATTYQPRHRRATLNDGLRMASDLETDLLASGFEHVTTRTLMLQPPAICTSGRCGA